MLLFTQQLFAQQDRRFSPKANNLQPISLDQAFSESRSISPFSNPEKIYGLALSGTVELHNKAALVRVLLVDEYGSEHLVYETYPLIANGKSFSIKNICEETSLLNGITPSSLKVEVLNASIHVSDIAVSYDAPGYRLVEYNLLKQEISNAQNDAKIELINNYNQQHGVDWIAARTDVSHLSYNEKKMLVNGGHIVNLQGFEYYKGGTFVYDLGLEDAPKNESAELRALPARFDWRERHYANKPTSPYYDGDTKKGGWFTTIQNQKCNQCWAFAPTATLEVLTNLYFNQHLDIDLSEQNAAACGGGASGECEGGNSSATASYIAKTGVVNEACMPYKTTDKIPCTDACATPKERIKAATRISLGSPDEAKMKKTIMDYGPVTSGVNGMWHFMCLQGFYQDAADGKNVWIFKNSYGASSGDNGFANIKITGSGKTDYLYGNFAFTTPLTSLAAHPIPCNDKDGDGYYWWGIGAKPASCPTSSPAERDGNDADPCLGPLDANYVEIKLNGAGCFTSITDYATASIGMDVFPNPSSGTVTVNYLLPSKAMISLHVINSLGQEIQLKNNEELQAGAYSQTIDNLNPGIYFIKLSSLNYSTVTKVTVIK
jgi:C1A family cysteine protease